MFEDVIYQYEEQELYIILYKSHVFNIHGFNIYLKWNYKEDA